ncbi:competence protein ComGB [Gracilibacillus orientalis]|uniref:Competence protein ComGB n=1 Tax=Gracilibacillus orientalis TaxID=334253 RepID=A0A1I4KUH4_9BACI|nr:competence type IV pilus assembly protein ComGB [Gracilibacillus orientalis]SFL82462.1 competence protein ComGB [Gracilibacillus orientalis]
MLMVLSKIFKWKHKLSTHDQYQILYRFEQLFRHGYSLNDALDVLMWDKQYTAIVTTIKKALERGETFTETLEQVHFNPEIISFLNIAIQHGNLSKGLQHCCQMLKQRKEFMSKLSKLSRYPLFLFIFFLLILYFMKNSIFPSFSQLLGSNKNITGVFQNAEIAINMIYYGTISVLLLAIFLTICSITMKQQITIESKIQLIIRTPIYSKYKRMQITYLLVTHLSSLLTSGLTIKDSLDVIKSEQKADLIHYYATIISDHLAKGYDYSTILPQCQLLQDQLTQIMSKDRNQDQLQKELNIYAEHLILSIESYLKKWISFLQPFLLCILAVFIVFVYLALMLPMFDYMNYM